MSFIDLSDSGLAAVPRAAIGALRAALLRDMGPGAAAYLQEAGYAGGEATYEAFRAWLAAEHGGAAPEALDLPTFRARVAAFFEAAGWGPLHVGAIADAVAALDSEDWGEADAGAGLEHTGCHLSTGMFADFFGRLAGAPLAVLEVECRSAGADRCRFLVGSAEVMQHVYDAMSAGQHYEDALQAVAAAE
jgi:uncharacterized protein